MKAAIITAAGKAHVYGDFNEPVASEGSEIIMVSAQRAGVFGRGRGDRARPEVCRPPRRPRRAPCCRL